MEEKNIYNGYSLCFNAWALDTSIKNELPLLQIISSLSAKYGYCTAGNQYLAELFNTTEETISRKINKLEKKNYIDVTYHKNGCTIDKRCIRLTNISTDDYQKYQSTIDENVKENNTNTNITKETTLKSSKESVNVEASIIKDCLFDEGTEVYSKIMEWLQYKREKHQTYKHTGLVALAKKLRDYADINGEQYVIDAIEYSMAQNYNGIYPRKDNKPIQQNKKQEEVKNGESDWLMEMFG